MTDKVETRRFRIDDDIWNKASIKNSRGAVNNAISTSKYNIFTFIPKNLFEQYQRFANIYFTILLFLQLHPAVSSLDWQSTFVPLFFVLMVAAIKDAHDDWGRHKSDRRENNTVGVVLENGEWKDVKWKDLAIGDLIKIEQDKGVPADCILLGTENESGEAYIETKDLDGETNLKRRETHPQTNALMAGGPRAFDELKVLNGSDSGYAVECDMPNTNLDKFFGTYKYKNEDLLLTNKNVLLRGCIVRNTKSAIGLVCYTGKDTKVMMNTGRARFKRTQVENKMNTLVFTIFLLLLTIAAAGAITNSIWIEDSGEDFAHNYNFYKTKKSSWLTNERFTDRHTIAFLQWISYIIVMNTFIPISLYVSVEFIRLGQSLLITFDPHMVVRDPSDPKNDIWSKARATTLTEEPGQIDYVFSDKTGTLTQNVMTFQQCYVGSKSYGLAPGPVPDAERQDVVEKWKGLNFKYSAPLYVNNDLVDALVSHDKDVGNFFRILAVCHTVRPDHQDDGTLTYQAESPDEKALVDAASEMGYKFLNNLENKSQIIVNDSSPESYEILQVIEFNSTRKRMSIIVRDVNSKIRLFSKGADSIMFDRVSSGMASYKKRMLEGLDEYSKGGLRTLVICEKEISSADYETFATAYKNAAESPTDRERNMEILEDKMERDLNLVGASAIEDKLQERVPETISKLKEAGMKVWVLTGDKLETAINIGTSAKLLNPEMDPLFVITGIKNDENGDFVSDGTPSFEVVEKQIEYWEQEYSKRADLNIDPDHVDQKSFGLVITGPALAFPMPASDKEKKEDPTQADVDVIKRKFELELKFLKLAKKCRAVLACRVSPLQKAKVVKCVKDNEKKITLAIGDGANDVSMIKEAHIGVGISGLEGRQAVNNSDYSMGQFRFLARLLLVHGRWSYFRMTKFLRYYFYKNLVFTTAQFWYAFYNGGSAQTDYDPLFISFFNVVFASLGIFIVGIFEQDVSPRMAMEWPMLYMAGPRNLFFSMGAFYSDLVRGGFHSVLMFFGVVFAMAAGGGMDGDGQDQANLQSLGVVLSFSCVMIVNLQLALEIKHWTWLHWLGILTGPVAWFILFGITYSWNDTGGVQFASSFYGSLNRGLSNPQFWAISILTIVICCAPNLYAMAFNLHHYPTPSDWARLNQKEMEKKGRDWRVHWNELMQKKSN